MKKKSNKVLATKPIKKNALVADHIDLEGEVIINGQKLSEGKDFILGVNGIQLNKDNEKLLDTANSYSLYFSRNIIKK